MRSLRWLRINLSCRTRRTRRAIPLGRTGGTTRVLVCAVIPVSSAEPSKASNQFES